MLSIHLTLISSPRPDVLPYHLRATDGAAVFHFCPWWQLDPAVINLTLQGVGMRNPPQLTPQVDWALTAFEVCGTG